MLIPLTHSRFVPVHQGSRADAELEPCLKVQDVEIVRWRILNS